MAKQGDAIDEAKALVEAWEEEVAERPPNPGYWSWSNDKLFEEAGKLAERHFECWLLLDREWQRRFRMPLIDMDAFDNDFALVIMGQQTATDVDGAEQVEDKRTLIEPERMLKASDVIEIIGISKSTLNRMVRAGTFPQPYKPTAHRVWKASEVLEFVGTLDHQRKSSFASRYKTTIQ